MRFLLESFLLRKDKTDFPLILFKYFVRKRSKLIDYCKVKFVPRMTLNAYFKINLILS